MIKQQKRIADSKGKSRGRTGSGVADWRYFVKKRTKGRGTNSNEAEFLRKKERSPRKGERGNQKDRSTEPEKTQEGRGKLKEGERSEEKTNGGDGENRGANKTTEIGEGIYNIKTYLLLSTNRHSHRSSLRQQGYDDKEP